ncbi:MAG: hypothetical protein KJS97_14610 [Alphaproteobacteria bacterium]|nr:hypothetical protein [Alphaproteobacteria bacterium]
MFVDPLRRLGQTAPARRTDPAAPGFRLPEDGAAPTRAATPAQPTAALDAILALQGEGPPQGRRARQVNRGRRTIDALEALQRAVVLGAGGAAARDALIAIGEDLEPTGDEGLDSVLMEIETRRAVELAKLGHG